MKQNSPVLRLVIAGFGGQGVLLAGTVLAQAALYEGNEVTLIPSYGAEMRGGTAHCFVTISKQRIANPISSHLEGAVLFNGPSLQKFLPQINENGFLLFDSSLIPGTEGPLENHYQSKTTTIVGEAFADKENRRFFPLPLQEIALGLGNIKVMNLVALGALSVIKEFPCTLQALKRALGDIFPEHRKNLLPINLKALEEGAESMVSA